MYLPKVMAAFASALSLASASYAYGSDTTHGLYSREVSARFGNGAGGRGSPHGSERSSSSGKVGWQHAAAGGSKEQCLEHCSKTLVSRSMPSSTRR